MAKRKFGEPPGRTRTKRQTKKKGNRYAKFGLGPAFVGQVAKELGEDLLGMGKTAFDPRPPSMRKNDDPEKVKRDALALGMAAVPGGKLLKPIAKAAKTAKKTTKTPGTSTVKKTTKKAAEKKTAAKKTTKKTTAKKTTPPVKPKSMIEKQRARDLNKIAQMRASRGVKGGRPQPLPKNIKTDAPGGSTSPGFRPKRTPKYEPEPTTTRNTESGQGRQRTYVTKTEAERDAMLDKATGGKWSKSLKDAPFGARETKKGKTGYPGKEKAHERVNKRDAAKRAAEKGRGKTSIQREKSEATAARRKKAGGSPAAYQAIRNPKLGGDVSIARMSPAELKKALKNPRSSESRLMKTLEKRAKRGNLREGEMQVLSRLRDNAPKASNQRQTERLMRDDIRSVGQGQAEGGSKAGFVNPPRQVKASNQKWRGEGGKDAPKGPKGKSGTSKRGDKVTERAKEEDGVTRIKGTGGQARRVIAPSKDVAVARGGPRGRRVGGGATSGRKPIALGSGRRTPSKDVVRGEVVRGGRTSGGSKGRTARPVDLKTKPVGGGRGSSGRGPAGRGTAARGAARAAIGSGAAKGKGKGKKVRDVTPVVAAVGAGGFAASKLGGVAERTAPKESDKDKVTPRPKKPTSQLRDKYGRKIDRAEFNRREAYRKSLEGMTEAEKKKARKAEMKRREAYRARKGKGANIITRNLDLKEGVSSRKVNKEMKAAAGKGGKRQAAIDARKKYQRKKK